MAAEGTQGLILYQTCCFWLQPEELCFLGWCWGIFPASPSSPDTLLFFFFLFACPSLLGLHLLRRAKRNYHPQSSKENKKAARYWQVLSSWMFFGILVLITRSWQVPTQSAEQFYQVMRKSRSILANSHALNLWLLSLYQTFSIGKPATMIFGEISLS